MAHVKQALAVHRADREHTPLTAIMGPAPKVPESLHLDALLLTLREPGLQMAVVVSEYGGTAGIVTLEDPRRGAGRARSRTSTTRAAGRGSSVRAAASRSPGCSGTTRSPTRSGLVIPEGPYDTLGGLVMARLGRVPRRGDLVDVDGWTLQVTEMDGRRVDRVLVTAHPEPPPADQP